MKNYTQVYVKNSFEVARTYCKAFGAEITREFVNENNTSYEHCELSVNGQGFLALAEAKNPCELINMECVGGFPFDARRGKGSGCDNAKNICAIKMTM